MDYKRYTRRFQPVKRNVFATEHVEEEEEEFSHESSGISEEDDSSTAKEAFVIDFRSIAQNEVEELAREIEVAGDDGFEDVEGVF